MSEILETTIRDGSYVIDFQWSEEDIKYIVKSLDILGFKYIELGHGLGLNASNAGKGVAFLDDINQIKIAKELNPKAKIGVFCIPGVANLDDIRRASDYGIDFIRIGTNITEFDKAKEFILLSKQKNLFVCANFMKSYAVDKDYFYDKCLEAKLLGADVSYLVDSSGCMSPEDVKSYIDNLKNKNSSISVGFHGHDNMKMAVANTVAAHSAGADIIDATMQGLGRDGGNASTEAVIAHLQNKKLYKDFNLINILNFSEKIIQPMIKEKGVDSTHLYAGISKFHSSFFPMVKRLCDQHDADPRLVMQNLKDINIIDPNEDDIKQAIDESLQAEVKVFSLPSRRKYTLVYDKKVLNKLEDIHKIAVSLSKKSNKKAVLNVVQGKKEFVSGNIQETEHFILCNCQSNLAEDILENPILKDFDYVLFDKNYRLSETQLQNYKGLISSKFIFYNDKELIAKSIVYLIKTLNLEKGILILGESEIKKHLESMLGKPSIYSGNSDENISCIIFIGSKQRGPKNLFSDLSDEIVVIDGELGSIDEYTLNLIKETKNLVLRPDMRILLDMEIMVNISMSNFYNYTQGEIYIGDIRCIAGGIHGDEGDIVLDDITNPENILGIANGRGLLKEKKNFTDDDFSKIQFVSERLFDLPQA